MTIMIQRKRLTVTLETVTPMFLAGANQEKPELRAPSFMGALRYWTRAALGGVLGDKNLEALKKAEEEVWGSTNGTGGVRVQLIARPFTSEYIKVLPHKPESDKAAQTRFHAVPAGTRFQIVLRQAVSSAEAWDMGIAALLLMTSHGGVGRRSRRGWGSLVIKLAETEGSADAEWHQYVRAINNLYQKRNLTHENWNVYRIWSLDYAQQKAVGLCRALNYSTATKLTSFPTTYPIATQAEANTPTYTKPTVYERSKAAIGQGSVAAIEAFGKQEHQFQPGSEFGDADPRWASPLWVRVLPVSSPQVGYILAMTVLKSDGHPGQANYERLQQFVEQLNES